MARNKYPEETVQKIIEAAVQLFSQKGYENTSIQDIIDQLGGLSKGAIYHHFRSKEELLHGVMEQLYGGQETSMQKIISDPTLTGLEKLRRTMEDSVMHAGQTQAFAMGLNMMENPRILVMQLRSCVQEVPSQWILPLVEQGIADGSLAEVKYPQQFCETFLLLANIWMNPMVFTVTPEELEEKCMYYRYLLRCQGVDETLVSDTIVQKLKEYAAIYQKNALLAENGCTDTH